LDIFTATSIIITGHRVLEIIGSIKFGEKLFVGSELNLSRVEKVAIVHVPRVTT
jgi:hypothetical protein